MITRSIERRFKFIADLDKEGGRMTITRYTDSDEQGHLVPMREDEDGDWVHYEDYEDEVNALKDEMQRLRNEISVLKTSVYLRETGLVVGGRA